MQSLKQHIIVRSEVRKEVWFLKCKGQGHDKDHYLVFANYFATGGRMNLQSDAMTGPSAGPTLWCAICEVVGKHVTNNFHLL